MQFIQSRSAKSKQTMEQWAMSWNRLESIDPNCHFTSPQGGYGHNSSPSEDEAKRSGFSSPEAHLVNREETIPIRLQGRRKVPDSYSPAWQPWRCLVCSLLFSVLGPLGEVAGWHSPWLAWPFGKRSWNMWWNKRKPGLLPVSAPWGVHSGRSWEVRAPGSKASPEHCPLTVPSFARADRK